MSLPALLYRYQSPTRRNIQNVKDNLLWISNPSRFNDPFDCAEAMVHARPSDVKADIFFDAFLNLDEVQMLEFAQALVDAERDSENPDFVRPRDVYMKQQLSKSKGVACFSEQAKHLLMWSHYASSHQGFCLEFSTAYAPLRDQLYRVTYQAKMPVVTPSEREFGDLYDLRQFLLIKAREWRYEKEWRVIHHESNTALPYPAEALQSILIGAKATSRTVNALRRAVSGRPVRIVRLKLSDNKYRLEEIPS